MAIGLQQLVLVQSALAVFRARLSYIAVVLPWIGAGPRTWLRILSAFWFLIFPCIRILGEVNLAVAPSFLRSGCLVQGFYGIG